LVRLSPRWGVDRSQAQTIIELAQHGIFAQAVEGGPGSVVAGIERVKSWMLSGRLKFVKSQARSDMVAAAEDVSVESSGSG
jgi:hypothetical protein